jgi:hypothetical protein
MQRILGIIGVMVLAAALCCGPVWAAPNVTSTTKEGSLLMFPLITVDPENSADTLVEISNFGPTSVHLECYYVNQEKGRVDFDFNLTQNATASWDVGSLAGENVSPAIFPTGPGNPSYPGNPYDGELVCFAVTNNLSNQIDFNHLIGSATVVYSDDADAIQPVQAFRYNAWSFAAHGAVGTTPGDLVLNGKSGGYDACPAFDISSFTSNGSTLGAESTLDNDLWVMSCNQDLRQDYNLELTKLLFSVWNANENSLTGSYQCADSVGVVGTTSEDNTGLTNPTNFDYSVVGTANASFAVQGIASTQCPGSTAAGLLSVLTTSIGIDESVGEDQELGSPTHTAGIEAGFVLWDPGQGIPHHN